MTSGSAGTPQPYRVEDVEPISPPSMCLLLICGLSHRQTTGNRFVTVG